MYLYRKSRRPVTVLAAVIAAVAALSPLAAAQWRRAPQPERKTPRAVAVLETYPDGQRRLIPVSFFYQRHYYDAGLYRATPVPFTLGTETVYEVEQSGKALGTFTVLSAMRQTNPDAALWSGSGRYRVAPDPATLAKLRAAAALVVLDDPTRPVLHRRAGSEGDRPPAHRAAANNGAPNSNDDPERPTLHRRESSAADAPHTDPTQAQPDTKHAQPDPKHAPAQAAETQAIPDEDEDHPVLRRGKPREEQGGRDLPEFNPALQPAVNPGTGEPGLRAPEPMARQVAVSDAGASEPQDVTFACRPEQRQQMEAQARQLAEEELRQAAPRRGLLLPKLVLPTPAQKTAATAPGTTTPATVPALPFDDEQFLPYDLDYNDYATVVFSARYRQQPANRSWVVTVIARQDGDKLVKLYSAISDPRELDLYPEVRLVDAVDPDGYGRYALLFRQQRRDGVKWLLGRVSGYALETLFETAER